MVKIKDMFKDPITENKDRGYKGIKGGTPEAAAKEKELNEKPKKKKMTRCWKGYKPTPGKKPYSDGSCMKAEAAAWTKKSGKNPEGGLNAKGRASYEKENPGSDLKAPQPEGGSRKKSFCARMGGMKKKMTKAKTANDPDSRINKSLRKWKC